jgi:hypothetical protein
MVASPLLLFACPCCLLLRFVHVQCVFNTVKERSEATEAGSVNSCPACAARASGHAIAFPVVPLPLPEEESSQIEKILGRRRVYLELETPATSPASPTDALGLPVLAGLPVSLLASPATASVATAGTHAHASIRRSICPH